MPTGDGLHPVGFAAGRGAGTEVEVDGPVGLAPQVVVVGTAVAALLVVVDEAAGGRVVDRGRPEQLGRRVGRDVQGVAGGAVQPVAVGVGAQVRLALARGLALHRLRERHRLVEPRGPLEQLVVAVAALSGVAHRQHQVPLPVGPVPAAVEPLGERVRLGHQLAGGGRLGQDGGQPFSGREQPALLDPELAQHRQVEPVALVDELMLGLPLGEGDQRQRPQVGLDRELEVELVEYQPKVRPQRQAEEGGRSVVVPSKIFTIFEGTSEIQRMLIGRTVTGLDVR